MLECILRQDQQRTIRPEVQGQQPRPQSTRSGLRLGIGDPDPIPGVAAPCDPCAIGRYLCPMVQILRQNLWMIGQRACLRHDHGAAGAVLTGEIG